MRFVFFGASAEFFGFLSSAPPRVSPPFLFPHRARPSAALKNTLDKNADAKYNIVMDAGEKTVNTAIVEDESAEAERLSAMLGRYGEERGLVFNKRVFTLASDFLADYTGDYDVVFMDIQLPDLDGMSAAKRLRETDGSVVLVFVTNMSQYAINGYEVNAADFVVKPLIYESFALKLDRIFERIAKLAETVLPVKTAGGMVTLAASNIKYIEVMGHELIYHTTRGEYRSYGSLCKVEKRLEEARFVRCNNYYLVNPRYVESVGAGSTVVGGDELSVSYARRKAYRKAIAEYLGGLV